MKNIFLLFLATTVALLIGCKKDGDTKKSADSKLPTNSELKIGVDQEFATLNPVISTMAVKTWLYNMAARTLTTIDNTPKWIPMMVEALPTLENGKAKFVTINGKKGMVAEWRIRDEYTWGDGTPVTGHDVKFGWTVARHPNVSSGEREVYERISKIEVDEKDPKKFTFTWDEAKWDYYQIGTFYVLPSHIEKPIFDKYVSKKLGYEKNTEYVKNPTNPGLYNGPYVVSEIKLGSHAIFTPNPHWKMKKPSIKKVIVKLIPNSATLEANLRSGTIDMISKFGLKMDQGIKFEKKVAKEGLPYDVNFKPGLIYEHIDLQQKNDILKDVRVRKALVFAINRKDLTQALFEGRQPPAVHNMAPSDPWYTDDPSKIVIYPYSPRKAKKLLEEAGWKMGEGGYRYKDGKKLSFEFMTTSGNKTRELVQTFLQDQWKTVGVEVIIRNEPARVYFGETTRKAKYKALAMYAWFSSPENNPKSTLHSKNIPTEKNGFQGQNSGNWRNTQVDTILDSIDSDFSHESRVAKIHKVARFYTDEVPVIPLYYRSDISVTPKNLTGYFMTGHQFYNTNFIENWNLQ